jgi:hypothetical protein
MERGLASFSEALVDHPALIGAVVVGIGAIAFIVFRRMRSQERLLASLVDRYGRDLLADVFVPNGVGGEIHLDHLLLTDRGLLLLETMDVSGLVFAGEKLDEWSATEQDQRVTFANPMPVLRDRVDAVVALAPGVPVEARLVFTGEVNFPKGRPNQVVSLVELEDECAANLSTPNGLAASNFADEWSAIKASATR